MTEAFGTVYAVHVVRAGGCPMVILQWSDHCCSSQGPWIQFPVTISFSFLSAISLHDVKISLATVLIGKSTLSFGTIFSR